VCGVLAAVAAGGMLAPVAAQPNAPIYLQYDGFIPNADGSKTLAFGYDNLNHVDVTIPAGPENQFTPGPADRQQPLTFLAGRHRFACVMVVPAGVDGQLQWQVKYAGRTASTTQKILDPLYQLELGSQRTVLAGLDVASAPPLTCANKSPIVAIRTGFDRRAAAAAQGLGLSGDQPEAPEPSTKGTAGAPVPLNATVSDDHLPRGGSVSSTWKKVSGPGDVTFGDASSARTTATFSAPGDYELELDASDGQRSSEATLKVTVAPAA